MIEREHRFGGAWTEEKLKRLKAYLQEYTKIMKGNESAKRYLHTYYVDAFAGTGYCHVKRGEESANDLDSGLFSGQFAEDDVQGYIGESRQSIIHAVFCGKQSLQRGYCGSDCIPHTGKMTPWPDEHPLNGLKRHGIR